MTDQTLQKELRMAGATQKEATELGALAAQLYSLQPPVDQPKAIAKRHRIWPIVVPVGIASLAVGMAILVAAQAVLPGSWLYPVQKISDKVAVAVHPAYRANVMMQHAQQVQELVAAHADSSAVMAALADYRTEANEYKSLSANYAAFEYCKSNLQQAASTATGSERDAIMSTLRGLQNV